MSDEALNAHLQWMDACAKEQETDYETWLEQKVALLEAEMAHKSRLLDVSEKAHCKTIEENATLKREIAGLNHLIDRVYELLTAEEIDNE